MTNDIKTRMWQATSSADESAKRYATHLLPLVLPSHHVHYEVPRSPATYSTCYPRWLLPTLSAHHQRCPISTLCCRWVSPATSGYPHRQWGDAYDEGTEDTGSAMSMVSMRHGECSIFIRKRLNHQLFTFISFSSCTPLHLHRDGQIELAVVKHVRQQTILPRQATTYCTRVTPHEQGRYRQRGLWEIGWVRIYHPDWQANSNHRSGGWSRSRSRSRSPKVEIIQNHYTRLNFSNQSLPDAGVNANARAISKTIDYSRCLHPTLLALRVFHYHTYLIHVYV